MTFSIGDVVLIKKNSWLWHSRVITRRFRPDDAYRISNIEIRGGEYYFNIVHLDGTPMDVEFKWHSSMFQKNVSNGPFVLDIISAKENYEDQTSSGVY